MLRTFLIFLICFCATHPASAGDAEVAEIVRPEGKNCELSTPPKNAGEETGHGVLLHVFPRIADINQTYTGCQAVFLTTAKRPTQLGWLVELHDGDPVRLWSAEPDMRQWLTCRYKRGKLVDGKSGVCPVQAPVLLPSMPAGCTDESPKGAQCQYDSE